MKQLAIHPCEKDITHWQGGDFISMDTIAVWSKVVIASNNVLRFICIQLRLLHKEILVGFCKLGCHV